MRSLAKAMLLNRCCTMGEVWSFNIANDSSDALIIAAGVRNSCEAMDKSWRCSASARSMSLSAEAKERVRSATRSSSSWFLLEISANSRMRSKSRAWSANRARWIMAQCMEISEVTPATCQP